MNDKINGHDIDLYLTEMRNGDQSAMERLYDCVHKPLFALCYGYFHNVNDSEDVLQEAFMTIKREIGKYKGSSGFNWVYTITKNLCLKALRRDARTQSVDFTDTVSVDKYYGSDAVAETNAFDESGIIRLSREVLNDNEYEILVFHAVYGIPFKEIAAMTKKIEATVRWQYHNAIIKVRKEYEKSENNTKGGTANEE